MIGHWLLQLSAEAEDALLGTALLTGRASRTCLVAVASGGACAYTAVSLTDATRAVPIFAWPAHGALIRSVPHRFDRVVQRFGIVRVAAAIRNRILANQARRVLTLERVVLRGAATPTGELLKNSDGRGSA